MKTIVAHNASEEFGGGEIWLSTFLAELQRRGHRVLMLCGSEAIAARARDYGIRAEVFRLGGILVFSDAVRFAARLRREKPDVVLLTTFKKAWLGGLAATLARVPQVYARIGLSSVTPRHFLYRAAVRWWLDGVITNAENVEAAFLRAMPNADRRRLFRIPNGVIEPTTELPRAWLRQELGIPTQARVVGTLARLQTQKNLARLLAAVAMLPADVHCIVAGEGPAAESLHEQATRLSVQERVHFIGFRKDVRSVLDALDVFVLSSDHEGLSTSMLQAMSVGVPIVSTRVSGTTEALAANESGIAPGIVVGFDSQELAQAILTLLNDPVARLEMGYAGRARVQQRFSFQSRMDEWSELLKL